MPTINETINFENLRQCTCALYNRYNPITKFTNILVIVSDKMASKSLVKLLVPFRRSSLKLPRNRRSFELCALYAYVSSLSDQGYM